MLLLDSHVFSWYDVGDHRLRTDIVTLINKTERVYVSAASIWELNIKIANGRVGRETSLTEAVLKHGFEVLPILAEHAEAIATLPRHHRDPFDHMLLAQAKIEGLTLVTHDRTLVDYGVPILLI